MSGANAAAYTTSYSYNSVGQLASTTDPDDGTTSYTYNSMGDPLTVTDPMGRVTSYAYDSNERLSSWTARSASAPLEEAPGRPVNHQAAWVADQHMGEPDPPPVAPPDALRLARFLGVNADAAKIKNPERLK